MAVAFVLITSFYIGRQLKIKKAYNTVLGTAQAATILQQSLQDVPNEVELPDGMDADVPHGSVMGEEENWLQDLTGDQMYSQLQQQYQDSGYQGSFEDWVAGN